MSFLRKLSWKRVLKVFGITLPYAVMLVVTAIHFNFVYQTGLTVEYLQDQAKFNKAVADKQQEMNYDTLQLTKHVIEVSDQLQQAAAEAQEYAAFTKLSMEEDRVEMKDMRADIKSCRATNKKAGAYIVQLEDILVHVQGLLEQCQKRPVSF